MTALLASGIAGLTTLGGGEGVTRPALPEGAFALPVPHAAPGGHSAWLSHVWVNADTVAASNAAGLLVLLPFAPATAAAAAGHALRLRISALLSTPPDAPDVLGTSLVVTKDELIIGCSDGTVRHLALAPLLLVQQQDNSTLSSFLRRTVRLQAAPALLLPPPTATTPGPSHSHYTLTPAVTRVSLSPACRSVYAVTASGALHCYAIKQHAPVPALLTTAPPLLVLGGGGVGGGASALPSAAASRRYVPHVCLSHYTSCPMFACLVLP